MSRAFCLAGGYRIYLSDDSEEKTERAHGKIRLMSRIFWTKIIFYHSLDQHCSIIICKNNKKKSPFVSSDFFKLTISYFHTWKNTPPVMDTKLSRESYKLGNFFYQLFTINIFWDFLLNYFSNLPTLLNYSSNLFYMVDKILNLILQKNPIFFWFFCHNFRSFFNIRAQ